MSNAYARALAYILSLTDLERRTDLSTARAELGLERMAALTNAIGHPQRAFWIVHVAGTKGKGSTSAMIERVLRAAGLRTGLYTSPHLHTYRERIRLCGRPIAQADVASLTAELRQIVEALPDRPSTFELTTALALLHFARKKADAAVLEVGMGGRLDATNVVTPRVSVITSISFDHMAVLGATLSAIAREKAGIIKPGVPVVSSAQPPEAMAVIERVCSERSAPLTVVGREVLVRVTKASASGVQAFVEGPGYHHKVRLPLMGVHQATNAATAIAALEILRQQGTLITAQHVTAGLRAVRWPGRMEIIGRKPLLLVDGAHNVDSAQKLRTALDDVFPLSGPKALRPRVLIIGMSADKDASGIMQALAPGADCVIVTRAQHPRAASIEKLEAAAMPYAALVLAIPEVSAALEKARHMAGTNGLICATGSLFIVADVRAQALGIRPDVSPASA